jgi:hypothetical protein
MMHLLKFLNQQDIETLNKWKESQLKKCRERQETSAKEPLDVGAIGGLYTYSFTPVSLGLVIKVTNNITQDVLDLSDYDAW